MEEAREPGPGEKRCSTCREIKPLEEFNVLRKAKDGRQYNCRACNMAYHYANYERHMEQVRQRVRSVTRRNKLAVIEHLLSHPCVDCGETDLVVLEFDHLRDKAGNVSRYLAASVPWSTIKAEIDKCQVVCANCHRRRTAMRANNYRWRFTTTGEL